MADHPGPIERSGYKQTLLHNSSGREGYGRSAIEDQHPLHGVQHIDSEDCPCNPIPMIWAEVDVWNPEMKRNMTVSRWVDKRTYQPPLKAHRRGNFNGQV